MNPIRRILTLRCPAATELASRQLDEPIPLVDRAALAAHVVVCPPCRRFRHQVRFLREVCRRLAPVGLEPDDSLAPEARARILRALESAGGDGEGRGPG